ncbi:MAG: tetratricopeptide repeat protein [Phycisphaerae bacterium]|nr:tetratricopeptide repeat protein [Phycisphaerae bacterium]
MIPGRELFHEHVHMTPEGNYLLAKACFERIVPLLPDSVRKDIAAADAPSQNRCFELIALTDWDQCQMHGMISAMLQLAPFSDQLGAADRRKRRLKRRLKLQAIAACPAAMDKARRWYTAAIQRTPDDPQLRRKFAILLRGCGDYGAAADQWRYLLKRFPDMARWHQEFAELLRDDRKFAKAISEFREAMRIDPFLTDSSLASIGQTLLRQNKQAEAETLFREALSANPALPHARGNLGAILYKQGKHDEAIRHLQMALQIDPNLILVHVNLATIFAKQDNFPEAIRHYREFLRIKPDDLPRRYSLASLLLRAGQIRESVDEHRQVLAQQGGHLPTLVSLARIFAACGDPKFRDGNEAVCIMERLCSRAGAENPQLLSVLAMAYAETGQFDKAVTTAEKALSLAKVNVLGKLVSQLQRELSFYRQTKPYRDPGKR